MIKREHSKKDKSVKVTFSLPSAGAFVAGDFNGWDAAQGRLQKRSNGIYSFSTVLEPGQAYQFRYLSEDGIWFNDDQADSQVVNEHGSFNSVVEL